MKKILKKQKNHCLIINMAFVVDTHALIWFLTKNKKLGKNALNKLKLADENKESIIIPSIVLAEIFYICENKRMVLDFDRILDKIENSSNYLIYDLNLEVIKKLKELTKIRELHDRIIAAIALLSDSKILTKDEKIASSNYVEVIW